ncbi:siderophore-interacting protein [Nocardiopsis sp. LOL_012]|uniref:siderophore-interacting protein n=1 Tax=Nocardiopsis sp. LOL_012 TaxID=3345409 RepID=UPI003A881E6B
MAERPERRRPRARLAQVQRVERLTPHMLRIVLGGPGLADLTVGAFTDHYVKLLFTPEGVEYPFPFDLARIREELPREQWPVMRTYTVRWWDEKARELAIDVVLHGDEGLAGPWAARARPGDEVRFVGPGGGYTPDPDADWHLLVGDESALPAIAASVESLPADARAHVFVEVAGPQEEQKLESAAETALTWVHRGDAPAGEALVAAVEGFAFPEGRVHAFVHGEAGSVKELRRLLLKERGLPREDVSISGYWRLGLNEDGWQAGKQDWNRQVEREQDGA